jgi:protein gp37
VSENTKIQWADHTFNPWRGCTKVAPGCANCYADAQSKRNPATLGIWGPNGTRVVASEAMWREPVKWDRAARLARAEHGERVAELDMPAPPPGPHRPRVFCASLADVFDDWRGPMVDAHQRRLYLDDSLAWTANSSIDEYPFSLPAVAMGDVRARLFRLIDAAPNLDWLLLTKRPENVRRMWPAYQNDGNGNRDFSPRVEGVLHGGLRMENVWLGTSIACQEDADRNVPELLKCRDLCAKLFLSIEPLIGPVDLTRLDNGGGERYDALRGEVRTVGGNKFRASDADPIDWVIVGGESGPNARPCNIEWVRAIVRQCRAAGVPVFVKQLGRKVYDNDGVARCGWPGLTQFQHHNGDADDECQVILRDPKGGDPFEWPEDVRVREVPA